MIAPGTPKHAKMGPFEAFDDNILIIRPSKNGFIPFGNSQQQRECTQSRENWEMAHKVNAPNIKGFDDQNRIGVKGISSRWDKWPRF